LLFLSYIKRSISKQAVASYFDHCLIRRMIRFIQSDLVYIIAGSTRDSPGIQEWLISFQEKNERVGFTEILCEKIKRVAEMRFGPVAW
jgi:hypothetical protein